MNTVPCKGCGAPVVWSKSPTGARLPLDAKPITVYQLEDIDGELHAYPVKGHQSHFATCPKANDFSRTAADRNP